MDEKVDYEFLEVTLNRCGAGWDTAQLCYEELAEIRNIESESE